MSVISYSGIINQYNIRIDNLDNLLWAGVVFMRNAFLFMRIMLLFFTISVVALETEEYLLLIIYR